MPNRKTGSFGSRGIAAQKLAIESTQNIANVQVSGQTTMGEHDELAGIAAILREGPMPISKVAGRLPWNSDRVAKALERGGQDGRFKFFKDGGTTIVALPE